MDEDSHTIGGITHRFLRALGIGGLAAIASLGIASRVNATSFDLDGASAGDYIDREWYHLLDDGQYQYLDRGQYNLLGGLGYLLGHACYPKLFERDSDQAVGFTNRQHTAWFSVGGEQVPISEYAVWSYHFNAGDYIDRGRYHYLDKGRYYYLDEGQYNLLGGLGYSFGRSYYQIQLEGRFGKVVATPEPSTIAFLGLGALVILRSMKY